MGSLERRLDVQDVWIREHLDVAQNALLVLLHHAATSTSVNSCRPTEPCRIYLNALDTCVHGM